MVQRPSADVNSPTKRNAELTQWASMSIDTLKYLYKAAPLGLSQRKWRAYAQCCGSGMFIPDPNFFHPWTAAKNILTQKIDSKLSEIWYGLFILDPESVSWFFTHPGSQILGSKRRRISYPGSRIWIRNTAYTCCAESSRMTTRQGRGRAFVAVSADSKEEDKNKTTAKKSVTVPIYSLYGVERKRAEASGNKERSTDTPSFCVFEGGRRIQTLRKQELGKIDD